MAVDHRFEEKVLEMVEHVGEGGEVVTGVSTLGDGE